MGEKAEFFEEFARNQTELNFAARLLVNTIWKID